MACSIIQIKVKNVGPHHQVRKPQAHLIYRSGSLPVTIAPSETRVSMDNISTPQTGAAAFARSRMPTDIRYTPTKLARHQEISRDGVDTRTAKTRGAAPSETDREGLHPQLALRASEISFSNSGAPLIIYCAYQVRDGTPMLVKLDVKISRSRFYALR